MTYDQAINSPDGENWNRAIQSELQSLQENNVWEYESLPAGKHTVGTRWLFKRKRNSDGTTRFKARLVAQGFSQKPGIDFHETFAPVLKYQSLRLLLSIANEENWHVLLEVKTLWVITHNTLDSWVKSINPQNVL